MGEKEEEQKSKEEEYEELLRAKVDVEREHELARTLRNQILAENEDLARAKAQLLELRAIEQEQLEKLVGEREKNKARLNEFISKKLEKDKQWKASEAREREI